MIIRGVQQNQMKAKSYFVIKNFKDNDFCDCLCLFACVFYGMRMSECISRMVFMNKFRFRNKDANFPTTQFLFLSLLNFQLLPALWEEVIAASRS